MALILAITLAVAVAAAADPPQSAHAKFADSTVRLRVGEYAVFRGEAELPPLCRVFPIHVGVFDLRSDQRRHRSVCMNEPRAQAELRGLRIRVWLNDRQTRVRVANRSQRARRVRVVMDQ